MKKNKLIIFIILLITTLSIWLVFFAPKDQELRIKQQHYLQHKGYSNIEMSTKLVDGDIIAGQKVTYGCAGFKFRAIKDREPVIGYVCDWIFFQSVSLY